MRTCLVTGGSGFMGIKLVRALLAEGLEVRIYDLNPPDAPDIEGGVQFIRGDVRDEKALHAAAEGVDSVFHLAAVVPITRATREFEEVNVGGTRNAVDAAIASGAEHFCHLSSSAIFGVPKSLPITEETVPTPLGEYGRAKLEGEQVARRGRRRGLKVAIVRPRTIVGPGRLGIFDILFDWIHHDVPIFMLGSGDEPFQLVSDHDIAQILVMASRQRADTDFNAGTDRFNTLRRDLNDLAEAVGSRSRLMGVPAWIARPSLRVLDRLRLAPFVDWHYQTIDKEFWFDCRRAQAQLGWRPRDSNLEMLQQAYEWYVGNRALDGGTQKGSAHRTPVSRGLLRLLSIRR